MNESRLTPAASGSSGHAWKRRGVLRVPIPTRTAMAVACGALLSCIALTALPASAASSSASAGNGWIRFAQFVPSVGPVNVKIDGTQIAADLSFRGVTGYVEVSAGVPHTVSVVNASAGAGAAALATQHASVPNGGAMTVAAIASTGVKSTPSGSVAGGVALQAFPDNLADPAHGYAKIRVIHTIPGAPRVNADLTSATVSTGTPLVLGPVGYAQASRYVSVLAGTYQVQIKALNGATVAVGHNWPVRAGTVTSIVIVETAAGPSLEVLSDAASAATAPSGGMQTGFGGTAPRSSLGRAAMLPVGLALLFFVALAVFLRLRRPLAFVGPRSLASRDAKRRDR
jgi:hypothetical protein